MSIKYRVIERGQPGVPGGGVTKWYARIAYDGECTMDDLVRLIEKFASLSESDIRGVIVALENVIHDQLLHGRIVRMEQLGTFYPALSSQGAANVLAFNNALIRSAGINYRPGKRLRDALSIADFAKVS